MAKVYRGVLFNQECSFYLTDATDMIQEIKNQTLYSPGAIAALGRSSMITAIMGLMLKDNEKLTTIINGGGIVGQIMVNANSNGEIKARISNPLVETPKFNNTKLNIGAIVGTEGYLRVIKDLNLKEPFVSEIPLISGEIAEDYTYYFSKSEQIPTAIAAGVLVDRDHTIKNASCFLVQLMPNASDETIGKLENFFKNFKSITDVISQETPEEFLENNFKNEYKILKTEEIEVKCDCSEERFINALKILNETEKNELKKDENIECVCDFCYKKYNIKTEGI